MRRHIYIIKTTIFLLFILVFNSLFAQRETIAIQSREIDSDFKTIININDLQVVNSFFNKIVLGLGYEIVERQSVNELFKEYEDQKREDYFDGKTIKAKLKGAKEILFIDIIYSTDTKRTIYYTLTDVFRNVILLNNKFVSTSNFEKDLESNKEEITNTFNKVAGLQLFYFGYDMKKIIKLVNNTRFVAAKGNKIYGFKKDNLDRPVVISEVSNQLSSNLIEANIIKFEKKNLGEIQVFDFSQLIYSTAENYMNTNFETLKLITILNKNCLNATEYFDLLIAIKKDRTLGILDIKHQIYLDFEKKLQSNELFIDGANYYKPPLSNKNNFKIICDQLDNKLIVSSQLNESSPNQIICNSQGEILITIQNLIK